MNYTVPILLVVAWSGLALALAPTPAVAGRLLRIEGVSQVVSSITRRRRVAPVVPLLLSAVGAGWGLAVGGILAGMVGAQGWLVGIGVAVAGAIWPRTLFTQGWEARFVRDINADVLSLLQMVYILSGVGRKPIDEAVRAFALTWAGQAALADLLLGCPPSESPVEFMAALQLPGRPYTAMIMAFRQAQEAPEAQREGMLAQHVRTAITNLKHDLNALAKKRAQTAIICGVLILLPTLMVTVLAPPFLEMATFFMSH